jgi:hypothetical protein
MTKKFLNDDTLERRAVRVAAALNTAIDELDRIIDEIRQRQGLEQEENDADPRPRPEP